MTRKTPSIRDSQPTIAGEIDRYLLTGESDPHHAAWPGGFLERANSAHDDLRSALVRAVKQRTEGAIHQTLPESVPASLTRAKVEPMVRGLFRPDEQDAVLAVLEQSVVFLTGANIEQVLFGCSFDGSAWTLANLYLGSLGAELLAEEAPDLVGVSEETTCYVSLEYFAQDDPYSDFMVHEAAHVFHNCKRAAVGLRETPNKEWLLDIAYPKRETFAYSCEAYGRVLEKARGHRERRALAKDYGDHWATRIGDERVDAAEVADIVRSAVEARNGWKVILARCAPPRERAGAGSD